MALLRDEHTLRIVAVSDPDAGPLRQIAAACAAGVEVLATCMFCLTYCVVWSESEGMRERGSYWFYERLGVELKNRSLEEIDELFQAKLWAWQFSSYETKGLAGRVAAHTQADGAIAGKTEESGYVMEQGGTGDVRDEELKV